MLDFSSSYFLQRQAPSLVKQAGCSMECAPSPCERAAAQVGQEQQEQGSGGQSPRAASHGQQVSESPVLPLVVPAGLVSKNKGPQTVEGWVRSEARATHSLKLLAPGWRVACSCHKATG